MHFFSRSTPLLHDSSVGNVPVCLHRPGPRVTPQAEESSFLAIIKGGRVGAKGSKVPTKIYFSTAKLILKPLEQAPGFSVWLNFASCCRLKDDSWWDGFQSWVLFYGGDFCFMFQEVFTVLAHNWRWVKVPLVYWAAADLCAQKYNFEAIIIGKYQHFGTRASLLFDVVSHEAALQLTALVFSSLPRWNLLIPASFWGCLEHHTDFVNVAFEFPGRW